MKKNLYCRNEKYNLLFITERIFSAFSKIVGCPSKKLGDQSSCQDDFLAFASAKIDEAYIKELPKCKILLFTSPYS